MNAFRLIGDTSKSLSILIMLYRLRCKGDGSNVSLKTQQLYCLVYVTRYLDLWTSFYSTYNSIMKIAYITSALYIVHMLHIPSGNLRSSVNPSGDVFKRSFVIVPSLIIAFLCTNDFTFYDFCWAFSIVLESVAIAPQLHIIYRKRCDVDGGLKAYCLFQFCHRFFYIFNWVYRSKTEAIYYHNFVVYFFGVLHCLVILVPWILHYFKIYPHEDAVASNLRDTTIESGPLIYNLMVDSDEERRGTELLLLC